MRTSAFVVLVAAIGVSLLPGCAPEGGDEAGGDSSAISTAGGKVPLRFAKDSVNVDDIFSNSVRVEADRLVVPTSKNRQMLAKIRVGLIVAGNRDMRTTDLTTSKNAYGFLRRVKEIKVDGGNTVLMTNPAELD